MVKVLTQGTTPGVSQEFEIPQLSASMGIIRATRNSPFNIPNNVAPYPAITYPMDVIAHRSSEAWTLNAAGEIVIPANVKVVIVSSSIYWGDNVKNAQYTMNLKRFNPNEEHFAGQYHYEASALYTTLTSVVDVKEGDRIAVGVRQSTGKPFSPAYGMLHVAAIG